MTIATVRLTLEDFLQLPETKPASEYNESVNSFTIPIFCRLQAGFMRYIQYRPRDTALPCPYKSRVLTKFAISARYQIDLPNNH